MPTILHSLGLRLRRSLSDEVRAQALDVAILAACVLAVMYLTLTESGLRVLALSAPATDLIAALSS